MYMYSIVTLLDNCPYYQERAPGIREVSTVQGVKLVSVLTKSILIPPPPLPDLLMYFSLGQWLCCWKLP